MAYALEDLRTFFNRRQFLVGADALGTAFPITQQEYQWLQDRTLILPKRRVELLRAFKWGYLAASQ